MMIIINLVILIIVALLLSALFNKEIEETIPLVVFFLLLFLYGLAIIGQSQHSYPASMLLFAIVLLTYIVRNIKSHKSPLVLAKETLGKIASPAFILYIVVLCLMYVIYSNHIVTVWDDFHYNATLPKDMYYYGGLPAGSKSATFYRSYLPLMQLFFYWGFQGIRGFSEHLMFFYKMFLIYTCMLPIFRQINSGRIVKRISAGVISVILPYCFMYELFESLSMDTFMAALFAYAMIHIIFVKERNIFNICNIALSLSCLSLVKQISPIFTAIALGSWLIVELVDYFCMKKEAIDETSLGNTDDVGCTNEAVGNKAQFDNSIFGNSLKNRILTWISVSIICGLAIVSWKLYCKVKGNTVYLSGKLQDSVGGGLFKLPDYGRQTIHDFAKSIFTFSMNLSKNGMPLCIVVILSVIILLVIAFCYNKREKKSYLAGLIVMLLGMLGYLLVLCYTYVFVFEQWEAESLSSIDRYLGTYAFALIYVFTFGLIFCLSYTNESQTEAANKSKQTVNKGEKVANITLATLAILLIATFPFDSCYVNLIPDYYFATHIEQMITMDAAANEAEALETCDKEIGSILIVTDEGNTLYSRGLTYNLIPLVPAEWIVDDISCDRSTDLLEKCQDEGVRYVYFNNEFIDTFPDAENSLKGAFEDGVSLERGHIYIYDGAKERLVN